MTDDPIEVARAALKQAIHDRDDIRRTSGPLVASLMDTKINQLARAYNESIIHYGEDTQ